MTRHILLKPVSIPCPLGPLLGPFNPADSGIVESRLRQIVRSASDLDGFLPGFG